MTLLKDKELEIHVQLLCEELKLWKLKNKKYIKKEINGEDKNRIQS